MSHVWTIAGFSPCASAGILADFRTFLALQVESFVITTALSAQNGMEVLEVMPVPSSLIHAQFTALKKIGWPKIIKIGLLPNREILHCVMTLLKDYPGMIIYDPVIKASAGQWLMAPETVHDIINTFLPIVTVFTPNIPETEMLTQSKIHSHEKQLETAKLFCQLGATQVVIKGGHFHGESAQDVWTDGINHQWCSLPRLDTVKTHGTGCTFSSALAAFLALDYETLDALVLAKMVVYDSIQSGFKPLKNLNFVRVRDWYKKENFPILSSTIIDKQPPFSQCNSLGFYPIVNSLAWVKQLITWGVKSIQLRIKDSSDALRHQEIHEAIILCAQYNVCLFINDEWELAIKYGAYGVHLGQEDLNQCDINKLQKSGLRLGISTHSYSELATALTLKPSYIALGPIFHTNSKPMRFRPQGLLNLKRWRTLVTCPLVGIGGITLENVSSVLSCGVDGISLISALTKAQDPRHICQQFLKKVTL